MTVGVVIVGAGQSGLNVASRLRELGYDKSIMLLGDEVHMPYQRPPLSKKFLSGAIDSQSLMLRPDSFFQDRRIDLALGVQGIALDTTSQRLGLSDGRSLNYESLVLATGTRARELPGKLGGGLRGVHVLRDLDQAVALQGQMISGNHLVVVGGGFVGLEVAATARQANMHVTVLEQASRILQRVAGHEVSRRVAALHRSHGVQILEQQQLTGLRGQDAVVREVSLTDGRVLPADLVLVGIGAIPNTELAQAGGLEVCDGIVVNANGLTSAPNVYACGDCARFPWGKDSIRLESVHHAIAHSDSIAQAITGRTVTYSPVPWFWSDQFDCKLQMVGLRVEHDVVVVRDSGSSPTQGASMWYFKDKRLQAVEALNDAAAFVSARRWLEQNKHPHPADLADSALSFKDMAVH